MRIELDGRQPLLRRVVSADATVDEGWLVIDARRLTFAAPMDLAGIVALSRVAAADGTKVALLTPEDADAAGYMERMDVFDMLPESALSQPPPPSGPRNDRSDVMMEVTALDRTNAAEVGNRIGRLLAAHDPAWARAVFSSVGELIDNAVSHGLSETGAFVAAQCYTGLTTGRARFEVAICDTGVGIAEHLRRNPRYAAVDDARSAVELALQAGVTGTTDKHRGNGLADLQWVTAGAGRLILRSGDALASVAIRQASEDPARARCNDRIVVSSTNLPGTWANVRAHFP